MFAKDASDADGLFLETESSNAHLHPIITLYVIYIS